MTGLLDVGDLFGRFGRQDDGFAVGDEHVVLETDAEPTKRRWEGAVVRHTSVISRSSESKSEEPLSTEIGPASRATDVEQRRTECRARS